MIVTLITKTAGDFQNSVFMFEFYSLLKCFCLLLLGLVEYSSWLMIIAGVIKGVFDE